MAVRAGPAHNWGRPHQPLPQPSPMSTLLLTLASLALPQVPQQGPAPALPVDSTPVVAFESVSVVPMDRERILDGQTVVVRDGKIAEIGPSNQVQVPEGAVRVKVFALMLTPDTELTVIIAAKLFP